MRSRQRVIQALRNAGKASPRSIKGPIGRASRRFRSGFRGPLVTVVLAISDQDTTKIGPMLWDLRNQSYRNIEVRLQPWGRYDAVRTVAEKHADADWRIVLARTVAPDASTARNAGAAAAKGGYLVFPKGGDNVPPHGIARLVRCLEASGSGLAVGRMRTPQTPLPVVDSPFGAAHQANRRGVTLAEAPVAATDLGLGNRMWRRGLWESSGIRFDPRRPSGTDVALASYAAGPFDLHAEDVYIPTDRRDGVAVGSALDILGTLDAWLAEHRATQEQLERLGQPAVTDAWLWGVLDTAIIPFVDEVASWLDQRIQTTEINAETALSKDTVPVNIDAVIFWQIHDPQRAALEITNYRQAITQVAQTSLREVVGSSLLSTLLSERKQGDLLLREEIGRKTAEWGVAVLSVEIRDIGVPPALQDAMSRQAQAEREKLARVLLGQAEQEIAAKFVEAAETYARTPAALQLRAMNIIYETTKERGATILMPTSMVDSMSVALPAAMLAQGAAPPKPAG